MAEYNNVYQRARYYDIALKRDVSQEIDFVKQLYRHHTGRNIESMLEIACGPGYHARTFAKDGRRAVGLDLRPEMIAFAADQAAQDGVAGDWLAADMRNFQLETPVDVAICLFDGLDALTENGDVVRHFSNVAANLTPNGLYLLDLTHPRDSSFQNYGKFRYTGRQNGLQVDIIWATNQPAYNPITGVAQVEIEMHITENGSEQVIKDTARERFFSAQEITLLAQCSGALTVVGWYGDFNLSQPLDNSLASQRMIAALQKLH